MRRATIAALLAVLAGCGNQPQQPAAQTVTPTPTPTPTATPHSDPALTHRQLVRALNASCAKHARTASRLARQGDAALERGDLPAAGRVLAKVLPYIRAHTRRAERLRPPPEDQAAFRRYLRAQRRYQGYGARLVRALKADDYTDAVRWSDLAHGERERRATAAIDLGANKCGS